MQNRLDELKSNAEQAHDIQVQLEEYSSNLNKQLDGYLADIGLTLHRVEGAGQAFFDETLQLRGVVDLLNQTVIAEGRAIFFEGSFHRVFGRALPRGDGVCAEPSR